MAKNKINIPAGTQVSTGRSQRFDFWFSDDLAKWLPRIKGDRVDKRFKNEGPWTGQKRHTKGKDGAL